MPLRKSPQKKCKNKALTHSAAHYLIAIDDLLKKHGYARLIDIAKYLNISKGSLLTSLKNLIQKKLVLADENKHYNLSAKGKQQLQKIKGTFFIVKRFLTQILDIDEKTSEVDACRIEHLLSKETAQKLLCLLRVFKKEQKLSDAIKKEMKKISSCPSKISNDEKCVIRNF